MKAFSDIKPDDLLRHPVWQFANDVEPSTGDQTFLRPHDDLPIDDFGNRIVGTIATFANGDRVLVILQNVDLQSPAKAAFSVQCTLSESEDCGTQRRAHKTLNRNHDLGRITSCVDHRGLISVDVVRAGKWRTWSGSCRSDNN